MNFNQWPFHLRMVRLGAVLLHVIHLQNVVQSVLLCCLLCLSASAAAAAQSDEAAPAPESWHIYGQFTNVSQKHGRFDSAYSGANSLDANSQMKGTRDLTLYAGLRLGANTEAWINPEIDQGFGLSNTLGVAGFPSGEAYKIGMQHPYFRLPRAFVRHVVELGGESQPLDAGPNQLAGSSSANKLTLTVGKFSAVDIFDTNRYAHDPRADFMNWSIVESGTFDYAADPWGFTNGLALEWTHQRWTLRGGVFQLSDRPNAKVIGLRFRQFMVVSELERRYDWRGRPGAVRVLVFDNRGDMASYRDAVALGLQTANSPDVSQVRHYQSRPGMALNIEQELAPNLGAFARASVNDGRKEAFDFTEINRSLSVGLSLKGSRWGREDDTVGVAAAINALSSQARQYFAAGGMGILIGDGGLDYSGEKILEAYYAAHVFKGITLTLNYQFVANPAYNVDRGPVNIYAIRLHAEF